MRDFEEILRWIDYRKEAMTKQLEEWVNIHSGSDNPVGLDIMFNTLYNTFSTLDAEIHTIHLQGSDILPQESSSGKKALLITKRIEAPIHILLGGHMDIVYPVNSKRQIATYIGSDKLKGPGSIDMKGGLVILFRTLEAFEQYEFCKGIGWQVLLTSDEETGSFGSRSLHYELAKKHHFGMIFEPTFPDGAFVTSRKGSVNFSISSKGIAAHAGRDFHSGKNAISPLIRLLIKLEKFNDLSKGITFNLGKIEGGGPSNIVPDLAIAKCNLRMTHSEDLNFLKEKIQDLIDEHNYSEGCELQFNIESIRPPKPHDENQKLLFSLFSKSASELKMPFIERESGGVCDGNFWADAGLPTIDTLGAIGTGMHTEDECIFLESLVNQTKLSTCTLMNLASKKLSLPNFKNKTLISGR